MANPTNKAGRGRPTHGRKIAFHVPLPPAKNAAEKNFDATDKLFCRLYAKDSVGYFLGLPLANYRKILAKPATEAGPNGPNAPVVRAVSDRVSAREYTLTLAPGTAVDQGEYEWYKGVGGVLDIPKTLELKTLQFSLPAYMPVWRILDWIEGKKSTYSLGDGESEALPDMDFRNYGKIIAITTPSQRTYPIRSILYPQPVPKPDPLSLTNSPPVGTGKGGAA